jgi:hypothetical protein
MATLLPGIRLFLSIIIISFTFQGESLAISKEYQARRHYYGGYIGFELGLVNLYEVAPLVGYRLIPRWHAGVGAKYQYYNDRRLGNFFRAHIFGPYVFTDLIAVSNLNDLFPFNFIDASFFIHGEMNLFSLPVRHFDTDNRYPGQSRFFHPAWLAGAGLRRQTTGDRHLHILLMWDAGGSRIAYSSPVLRVGFMF